MFIFALCIGIIIGLMIGTYLGAQIIDEKNRELKYLRSELAKAAYNIKEEGLFSPSFFHIYTPPVSALYIICFSVAVACDIPDRSTSLHTVRPV